MIARGGVEDDRRRPGVLRCCAHGSTRSPAAVHDCLRELRTAQHGGVRRQQLTALRSACLSGTRRWTRIRRSRRMDVECCSRRRAMARRISTAIQLDGTKLERLTNDPAFDDQAVMSPDGTRVAFVSSRTGQADIWLLDLRTRRLRNLTNHPGGDYRPAWSPDGQWIAFTTDRDSDGALAHTGADFAPRQATQIYRMRPDGTQTERLTKGERPVGRRVVVSGRKRNRVLRGGERRLASAQSNFSWPCRLVADCDRRDCDRQTHGADHRCGTQTHAAVARFRTHRVCARRQRGEARSPGARAQLLVGRHSFHRRQRWPRRACSPTCVGPPTDDTWSSSATSTRSFRPLPKPSVAIRSSSLYGPDSSRRIHPTVANSRAPVLHRAGCGPGFSSWMSTVRTSTCCSTMPTASALAPTWSPAGDRIAFGLGRFFPAPGRYAPAQIAVIGADGSGLRRLTPDDEGNYEFPSWSPDGKRIVLRSATSSSKGLSILDVESGTLTPLTPDSGTDNLPAWSPKGDVITFTSRRDGDWELYSIRPDGTGLKRLTRSAGNDAHASWSHDGRWLAFSSARGGFKDEMARGGGGGQGATDIFVMRPDGTDVRRLTDDATEEGTTAFAWK